MIFYDKIQEHLLIIIPTNNLKGEDDMAHDHGFAFKLAVLKTSSGYLTKVGFTQDVTSPDVLSVRTGDIGGKWVPKQERIERFKEHFDISIEIQENECEFFTYKSSDELKKELNKWF